ncbi:hypothetical protein [Frankia sp. AgKG'84/4]|uniref:hypothetical protein n=1 Tax=Frankia sp. AgKG'84/4 TaxID=573490 RepID=UPI00200C845C|nr:hypothetical protein [Frankia sp. AgKG'84/4]
MRRSLPIGSHPRADPSPEHLATTASDGLDARAGRAGTAGQRAGGPGATEMAGPETLRTEFEFDLPRGYVDENGTVHRRGSMRLATARDELVPLRDIRVRENPPYLSVVLLARVVTRLGGLPLIHDGIIENLFASDLAFLQDLYQRINADGHTRAAVVCPSCATDFEVEFGGSRLGES